VVGGGKRQSPVEGWTQGGQLVVLNNAIIDIMLQGLWEGPEKNILPRLTWNKRVKVGKSGDSRTLSVCKAWVGGLYSRICY